MATRNRGRVGVRGAAADGPLVSLTFRVEGLEQTTDEFRRIRRDINTALRDAMERAGARTVIPAIKSALPRKDASVTRGLPVGAMASSIAVKRDRLDVTIRSTLPKNLDRALGWLDFGGKRPRDTNVRVGPHIIVSTLDTKASAIDDAVYRETMALFHDFNTSR